MRDVEIRQLHYFVTVAEEENFTRAAQRLAMTQPALSRAVQALEKTLGTDLLLRTPKGLALTAAGRTMLTEGRSLLAHLDDSVARVRRAALPETPLAVTGPGCDASLLDTLVRSYNATDPPVPARAEVGTLADQKARLHSGRADMMLSRGDPGAGGLRGLLIRYERAAVLLAARHRLADRQALDLADLTDEVRVTWSAEEDPLSDPDLWPTGLPGRPGPPATDGLQMMALVGLGQAMALTVAPEHRMPLPDGVVSVPLRDGPRVPLRLLWSRAGTRPDIDRFARHAVRTLRV